MIVQRAGAFSRTALAACAAALMIGHAGPAAARDGPSNQPGQFDFYVLALSWSPSYCEGVNGRGRRNNDQQCGERPYSFVVHGLWPQYEKGFPESCQVPAPRLYRGIVASMLDLMPSRRLIFHEWDTHGTCSGLNAQAYFDTVRKVRAAVTIPQRFEDVTAPLTVTPDQIEDAFVKSNPGLTRGAIAVACSGNRLSEVRLCVGKDFKFRDCAEIDKRACGRDRIVMPPVRGASLGRR